MAAPNRTATILEAAKATFLTSGYRATSMDMVADRAGVTRRTIYNNFKSKEHLLEAVVDEVLVRLSARLPPLPAAAKKPALLKFAEAAIEIMCWQGAIGMQRLIIADGDTFPDLGARLIAESDRIMEAPVTAWLRAQGYDAAGASGRARDWLNGLTAPARLDRLLGRRSAYAKEPGSNTIDVRDRAAASEAVEALIHGVKAG